MLGPGDGTSGATPRNDGELFPAAKSQGGHHGNANETGELLMDDLDRALDESMDEDVASADDHKLLEFFNDIVKAFKESHLVLREWSQARTSLLPVPRYDTPASSG